VDLEKAMTRDEMIRLLVLDRLEHREDFSRYLHLEKVLENGFRGFRNLTDQELLGEIRVLGLETPADNGRCEDQEEVESELNNDDIFDSSLMAGHAFSLRNSGEYF
jgi:hypothetical protein